MTYVQRRGKSAIVVLGNGEDQARQVEGVLIAIRPSEKYESNFLYDVATGEGETLTVAGCAALNNRLGAPDVGKRVLIRFAGMGRGKSGASFKAVEVFIDDGADEEDPGPAEPPEDWPEADDNGFGA